MREAGRVVAAALDAVRREAAIGVSLADLDEVGHEVLRKAGARSPFLNYHPSFAPTPFPAVICASVNDVIVHGIPDGYRLTDGDLVSIDFGAELDGWTGDAAISFIVGTPNPADEALIESTEKALAAGIAAAAEGARLGDISHAIGTRAPLRGDGDGDRAEAGFDRWHGRVGGGPDRGHLARQHVGHVGSLPVRGDRDASADSADVDRRQGRVGVGPNRGHCAASGHV